MHHTWSADKLIQHVKHGIFSFSSCKTSCKASATEMQFIKLNTKTCLWITAHQGVHTWTQSHTQPTQTPSTINCLRLMNVDAQEWACWSMALCIESWQPRKGWLRTGILQDGEIKLVVGEARVRRHTATFSTHMHLVCSVTHGCHSNICLDQLEDSCSSNGQMITKISTSQIS